MARQHNVPVPHISLMVKEYEEAERRGWSHYATTKVRCLQEERVGVIAPSRSTSNPQSYSTTALASAALVGCEARSNVIITNSA